jgi:aminoglycoside phosphotransferase (APT) family kinase protein
MATVLDLPTVLDELTPAWLTSALGWQVDLVQCTQIAQGEGFIGQLGRLTLAGPDPSLPATVIAKLPTTDPGGQFIGQLLRLWEREHRFYAEVAPQLSIRVPSALVNLADAATNRYVLVLEDLAPAAAADQVQGASADQAARVITDIARFHAQWWQHPLLDTLDWMPVVNDPTTKSIVPMFEAGYPSFVERYKDRLPAQVFGWLEAFAPSSADFLDQYVDEPATMIHGDFRLDNMLFDGDGTMALVDWQMATRAPGMSDVTYFLGTNLDPEVRRRCDVALIERYAATLAACGVADVPDRDSLLDGYRKGLVLWMVAMAGGINTLDPANERGVALFDAIITRLFEAGADHDAGRFLPEWLATWRA